MASLSTFQKVALFAVIATFIIIAWIFLFGGVSSIWELAFVIILIIVLFFITWLVLAAVKMIYKERYFSPKEDYFTKLANMAIDYCPDNLYALHFQGSDWKKNVFGGNIIGCIGIPYLIATPKLDGEGNMVYYESKLLKRSIPVYAKIEYGKDGDTLFIYEKGWFIFKRRHYLRCNHNLHSELNGDITIFDINPLPYGKFFEYPYKQIQKDMHRIMIQSQLETILATHEHQSDLISQAADAGIYYNPYMRMLQKSNAEISREG